MSNHLIRFSQVMTPEVCPKLLVSVRNAVEARAAVEGGADIIDLKEPSRGSLGMTQVDVISNVLDAVASLRTVEERGQGLRTVPVSAALGEVVDWQKQPVPSLPGPLAYVKLGLSDLAGSAEWQRQWLSVRRRFEAASPPPLPRWIAVIYADRTAAQAPDAQRIIDAAAETACAGVLFDTFEKRSGDLFSHIPVKDLAARLDSARKAGLRTAVAGRLSATSISQVLELPVDIIAVRSSACRNQDRNAPVCSTAVRRLSLILHRSTLNDQQSTNRCPTP